MPDSSRASDPVLGFHEERRKEFASIVDGLQSTANKVGLLRFVLFAAATILVISGFSSGSLPFVGTGVGLFVLFAAAVAFDARLHHRIQAATMRRDVHHRHIDRLSGLWVEFDSHGSIADEHPYAGDIDLVGEASLFQWLDVTHTSKGESTLISWLSAPADPQTIASRQGAVGELAQNEEFRQEFEAVATMVRGDSKLDAEPFLQFTRLPAFFDGRGWLVPIMYLLPALAGAAIVAVSLGLIPRWSWVPPVFIMTAMFFAFGGPPATAFELIAARRGFAESFSQMLRLIERSTFSDPLLSELRERIHLEGVAPSAHLSRLDRWAGLAELRTQFPLNIFLNIFLLWDLHVLYRLEAWNRDVGTRSQVFFDTIGELEALCALATLKALNPNATFPTVNDGGPLRAQNLVHPLLPAAARVANDVEIPGPGHALIVTGSNMAGKSTLLRSLGLNVALALAGGAVSSSEMTVPRVRMRASMRAKDSLKKGASYFHAELTKLRTVVGDADAKPPVFFLLDELLRGTNERARHLGAKAVLLHLLERDGMGIVATHDVALAKLESESDGKIANAHFTDVMRDGEMLFDYQLQPGVVKSSNALRLLAKAGIEVPDDDGLTL